MCRPKFEDIHPFSSTNGYTATNEDIQLHQALLRGRNFKRAASIASGGEVPFLVLLPRCREVVAADHSYTALAACMLKAIILERVGPRELLSMLWSNREVEFNTILDAAKMELPEVLKPISMGGRSFLYTNLSLIFRQMRLTWFHITPAVLEKTMARMDSLTLIHGDITDLVSRGQFNVLYASNVHEHSNRNKKMPSIDSFAPLVKVDGLLLATGNLGSSNYPMKLERWKLLQQISSPLATTVHNHGLLQRIKPATKQVVKEQTA